MTDAQNIEDRIMSPQCFGGQHDACKHTLSFIAEDGVGRTMTCPCRCHEKAPEAAFSEKPESLYVLSWEYELKQDDLVAWVKRKVLAMSKEAAGDWIDAVAQLTETNQVRKFVLLKYPLGKGEKIN